MATPTRISLKNRLIGVAIINQFGSWLSFLAIVLYAQQEYGSLASSVVFLVQTVPALLAARSISDRLPAQHARIYWVVGQAALGALTVALAFVHEWFGAVLIYVALSMLVKAILSPLYMSLVVGSVPHKQRRATMTGVGAAGSIAIVVAPALGGLLLTIVGPASLFLMNAATYAVVAALVLGTRQLRAQEPETSSPMRRLSIWSSIPSARSLMFGPSDSRRSVLSDPVLATWVLLLFIGALLNSVETPFSFDVLGVSQAEFGWILSCFGLGGLAVLVGTMVRDSPLLGPRTAVAVYAGGLVLWMFAGRPGAYLGFFLAGIGGAVLSGWARSQLDEWSEQQAVRPQLLWGWANQSMLFVNLVSYGAVAIAFALGVSSVYVAGALLMFFAPFFVVVERSTRRKAVA